ncbi:hypothetical protein FZI02_08110 [Cronobacter sakazakii]|nr:hypothetical protein [Cronobacter sakazakii]EJG0747990.1 hypothetical protein [Cronobacter sakazakii]KAB0840550.1 hypothetical protein FZI02_08110 [Cronobacter sakazakii]KAB0850871.1 hypothetical protein FZI45_00875 [Cronobacter sakazakii]
MNEQANKILVELLQKASNGIDAAVSFSQAQIPDVIHQLLIWNMVHSLIMTLIAISTIPLVFWFVKRQCRKVEVGKFGNEGYSWDRGNPKYSPTMVWDSKGELSFLIAPGAAVLFFWVLWVIAVVTKMTWLKIWLAPKLYLIEYAASLVK